MPRAGASFAPAGEWRMSGGFQYFDILVLAAIAVFILYRLYRALGRRTGNEGRHTDILTRRREMHGASRGDKVVRLPDRSEDAARADAEGETALHRTEARGLDAMLAQIAIADRAFEKNAFLVGARAAFEIILDAFASGDTGRLRLLLADDVYDEFAAAIRERQQKKQTLQSKLVSLVSAEIVDADLVNKMARVTVKFVSEQITVLRDEQGKVVEGDPDKASRITDIWTFERYTLLRDPNWKLAATQSPQ